MANTFGDSRVNGFRRQAERLLKPKITFTATPLQVKWIEAVTSGMYKFLGIGGGIRGTKTFACLSAIILLCRIFPRSRWAVVRKDLPTLRRNVIPSMEKLRLMGAGSFVGPLNMSDWSYKCDNGSVIILFPEQFIQDPELERWKGLEVNGFDLEEGSELSEKAANKAIERAGSWIIPPTDDDPEPNQPPPLVLVNFNPCANWPRKWFYEPWKNQSMRPPFFFLPATIADNPYASEEYKESLKYLPPEEYRRFVMGEWDFVDDPNQLIKTEWLWAAMNVEAVEGPNRLACDVARYGDDYTSVAKGSGNQLRKMLSIKHYDTTEVGTTVLNECGDPLFPVPAENARVDGVGLGAGTVDYCRKQGLNVREFIAGAKPVPRRDALGKELTMFKFKDLRSQAWWEGREKFRLGQFCLQMYDAKGDPIPLPPKLMGDLATPRYEISGDKVISVETKEEIKKRLGRSTDDGDAVIMLMFDMPPAPVRAVLPGSVVVSRGV